MIIDGKHTFDLPDQSGQSRDYQIRSTKIVSLQTADDKVLLTEPSTATNPDIRFNKKEVTLSGHTVEKDDTPGAERLMTMHKSGTFEEIGPDGTKVTRIYGDNWEVSIKDKILTVGGDLTIVVQGDASIMVNGNCKEKILGNYDLTVHGDMAFNVKGKITQHSGDDYRVETGSNLSQLAKGLTTIESAGNILIDSKSSLNISSSEQAILFGGNNLYLEAGRIDLNLGITPTRTNLQMIFNSYGLSKSDSISVPSFGKLSISERLSSGFNSIVNEELTVSKDRTII